MVVRHFHDSLFSIFLLVFIRSGISEVRRILRFTEIELTEYLERVAAKLHLPFLGRLTRLVTENWFVNFDEDLAASDYRAATPDDVPGIDTLNQ